MIPAPFSQRYRAALKIYLAAKGGAGDALAGEIAALAGIRGVRILDFAKFHELCMAAEILPGVASARVPGLIRRAAGFFAAVATSVSPASGLGNAPGNRAKVVEALSRRGVELARANRAQAIQLTSCRAAEVASRANQSAFAKSLKDSELLKAQLRGLSRQILSAQEDERKIISRELHDVIAQTLIGINLRLATLKKEAEINTKSLVCPRAPPARA
jgi:signal transduction histidine kinase